MRGGEGGCHTSVLVSSVFVTGKFHLCSGE